MPIQSKTGGAWRLIGAGKLNIRWGGVWHPAGNVYRKIGDVGGGYWYNTGYQGIPATPTNFSGFGASNPLTMTLYWAPGAGGATLTGYQILISMVPGGDVVYGPTNGTPTTITFGLNAGTRYTFRIQAVAAGGMVSPYTANTVQITTKP